MKIIITESQLKILKESFKITFEDKRNIDLLIRKEYNDYLKEYDDTKNQIKIYDSLLKSEYANDNLDFYEKTNTSKEDVIKELERIKNGFIAQLDSIKSKSYNGPKRYNEFYNKEYKFIKEKYLRWEMNNPNRPKKKYNIPNPQNIYKIDDVIIDNIKNSLTKEERINIKKFLNIVSIRQDSGTGESISKKDVRDAFFNTPESFRKLYSVKPTKWMWRGDDYHPCDEEYVMDEYDKYIQSFSETKYGGQSFGSIAFNAKNIKNYSGSFSLTKYVENPMFDSDFGDDEGEIMFFDVEYNCEKRFNMNR